VIQGYVEELLEGPFDRPETVRKRLEVLKKNADRLGSLVTDILDLSRIESKRDGHEGQTASVHRAVEQVLGEYGGKAGAKGLRLVGEVPRQVPHIPMNELHLIQTISNLVDNAIKYSREGGAVTVRVLPNMTPGFLRVQVEDQGIGIAPEETARVFERFYRVDKDRSRASGGTGLGLSIVRSLVERYGGSVGLTSRPGTGSTFYFDLPL
jgi:signal transduction histidine kinase